MKRLLAFAFILCSVPALADGTSDGLLKKLSDRIKGFKDYEVRFTARSVGQMPDVSGYYIVSGERYYISVDGREVYCDGRSKFEVDPDNMEVVADKVNPRDRNILSNPTRAFEFLDGSFSHTYKGKASYAGKECDVVELIPLSGSSIDAVTLYLNTGTGLPAGIKYTVEGFSQPVEVSVDSFVSLEKVDDSFFKFQKEKYKDYEIIDFR